jgi:geranylgeranyl diphosphate synthase type II
MTTRSSAPAPARKRKPAAWPAPFERDRRAVDRYLAARLARLEGVPPRLAQAIRFAALAPGKRLRPLLVLLGFDAAGGTRKLRAHALAAGAAVEMIHAFSLVHDDLPALDDDDLRRGRPTLHRKFDDATAILAGDALLALAFEDLARLALAGPGGRRAALALFELATATGPMGMIGGQMLDLAAEGRWGKAAAKAGHTVPGVRAIHRGKTAALIAASLVAGGSLAGADAQQLAALEDIGLDLGLAFQIADDLLNETGSAQVLGKNAGTDRARGKATWPAAAGTKAAQNALATLSARAVKRSQVFPTVKSRFATLVAYLAVRKA